MCWVRYLLQRLHGILAVELVKGVYVLGKVFITTFTWYTSCRVGERSLCVR